MMHINIVGAAALLTACSAFAGTTVYRLELTDGQPYVVGVDGERRPVVLVSPDDWTDVTNFVAREIAVLNSTETGRIRLHGPRKRQIVNDDDHEKTTVYDDGYLFVEKMVTVHHAPEERRPQPVAAKCRPAYSKRYAEMLNARAERARSTPTTVTVNHDAATGKDSVQ